MFDYTVLHWSTFLTAAALLNLSPGPDMAFILGQTLRGGRKAGFAAMSGIWTGALGHALLAAAGLSAILASSALAFGLVKWVGAAYLIWLGLGALRAPGGAFLSEPPEGARPGLQVWRQIWRQGVFVSLLNPKVAIFFLAFLPQFVVAGAGPVWAQLFLHGFLVIAVAALIEPPLVLIAETVTRGLRRRPGFGLWLDRALGTLLVGLGVGLAFQQR
ncbi:LysE family translocator [Rhodobacter capsulatus]|uniref:LysE family translocator n=1 Tax=Rhodobacter capsulatus TaxID=1061 RepID=UPI0006DC050E|nr:LysE family translocator [Rhodobacter capsulatus]KQB16555.1 lysine transporter LysE [Rhodobacter capsulatus]KQB17066.1 lysine transporter LysE [Rhodobacter capsulatus]PZX21830.1 threonine/homoserine/homoserine lactone efflux protein [Rhodobacter capsulatus]QNR62530.1 LysE family translocator [Rhodobacter capsulatus]